MLLILSLGKDNRGYLAGTVSVCILVGEKAQSIFCLEVVSCKETTLLIIYQYSVWLIEMNIGL